MKRWSISAGGKPPFEVPASNWISALGAGLERLGQAAAVERLACEVLPNGTVIARDAQTGARYVIQAADEPEDPDAPTLESADLKELDSLETLIAEIDDASSSVFACQAALEAAQECVPAESASVILEQEGYLRFVAAVGPFASRLVGVRLPLGTGLAGFSIQRNEQVVVGEAQGDPRHCNEMDRLTGYHTRQLAVLPVAHGERVYGVIEVLNLPAAERFTQHAMQQLMRVAGQLGERLSRLKAPTTTA